jgi:glycosyltransferase involved in cell wall biosynthesis
MISGAAISVRSTAEAMAKRGHQVLVIAASDRNDPYNYYNENLTVLRLRSFQNPMRIGQRLISSPRHDILKALDEFKPDVINAHEGLQVGMIAFRYARKNNIPSTLTTHQLPWFIASYFPQWSRPMIEQILWGYARLTLKKYSALISPTRTIADIIESKTGLQPHVIGFGVDLDKYHSHLPPNQ